MFIGLCVGSFLNVVIHRLPIMERRRRFPGRRAISPITTGRPVVRYGAGSIRTLPEQDAERFNLMVPRSACPHCGHQITALENVPIISWLALRGRCSACKTPISARYPIIEG